MYERENTFYEANKAQLRQKYPGKELVIVGDKIIGVYDDLDSAVDETEETHPLGTFCVKSVPVDPAWENWEIFTLSTNFSFLVKWDILNKGVLACQP